jgi:hypothetical protein
MVAVPDSPPTSPPGPFAVALNEAAPQKPEDQAEGTLTSAKGFAPPEVVTLSRVAAVREDSAAAARKTRQP